MPALRINYSLNSQNVRYNICPTKKVCLETEDIVLKNSIKFLQLAMLSLFLFACSGNEQPSQSDSETQEAGTEEVTHNERPEYDFRKTRWGMSRDEVKANEPSKLAFENENSIEYTVFIDDLQAQTSYKFQDDKLIRAGYYFPKEYDDKNEYIETYEKIKEMIMEAKGPPALDKVVELDPSSDIDPENKGQAVCDGKLIYGSQWNYPGSDIQLVFRGDGKDCFLTVNYLKSLPDEPEEEKASVN